MPNEQRILWVDDEIDLLKPHILFLEDKGYEVVSVTNGPDAIEKVKHERFDVIFLDEQMPGLGGLETLEEIMNISPELPVVMITKSEEENLMEDAIGSRISDYLIKPVKPNQILLTCKRILDRTRIRDQRVSQDYLQSFSQIGMAIGGDLSAAEWVDIYNRLVRHERELEGDEGLRQVLQDQYREANREFGRYVEENYPSWIQAAEQPPDEHRPPLSHEVLPRWVFPELADGRPLFFFLIDCLRQDQWLEFERLLYPLFDMEKDYHFSILPTATPYSRNAIFSGMLPIQIAQRYPSEWREAEGDEHSRNRHEEMFLEDLLKRRQINTRSRYEKIVNAQGGRTLAQNLSDLAQHDFIAVVVNFVDILAHSRSDSDVLKEIAPDERAYRALTRTWFEHSWLYQVFQELAQIDCSVIITSDHGVVRSLHATKVIGDRETSTSLRYKFGRNLKCESKHAIFVKDPEVYGLPRSGINTNYILAKEDYYFVYPTNYHRYLHQYKDSMQHGGASMEEMILPVVRLRPKS